jgi:hypothetical protein
MSGTISFNPPLTIGGMAPETTVFVLVATHCTGGTPNPTTVNSTSTITGAMSNCGDWVTASPPSFTDSYKPAGIDSSPTAGGVWTIGLKPRISLSIMGATTVGSYPSTNTAIQITTTEKWVKDVKRCRNRTRGLKSLRIKSGSITNL